MAQVNAELSRVVFAVSRVIFELSRAISKAGRAISALAQAIAAGLFIAVSTRLDWQIPLIFPVLQPILIL